MSAVSDSFQGAGTAAFAAALGWAGSAWNRRRKVKAAEIDRRAAQGISDRQLLETIYSVMVTPEPTPLDPNPAPRLIDRVERIDDRVEALEAKMIADRE